MSITSPVTKHTTLGQSTSSVPISEAYEGVRLPQPGEYFVLADPSTPIRQSENLDRINALQDQAELGTTLPFGHPMKVREVGASYSSVQLSTQGDDPAPTADFHLGLENHKLRIPITRDMAHAYAERPLAVVTSRLGVKIEDLRNGARHHLTFGARIPSLVGLEFSLGEGEHERRYKIVDGAASLGKVSAKNVSMAELTHRVRAFEGAHFSWGHSGPELSDASGWVQSLMGSFGIHLPHNTKRMERHIRQNPGIGTEIQKLSEITTGDIIFIGPKAGSLNYVGLAEFDDGGRLGFRHCRGKCGWQGNYINGTSQLFSETEVEGFPGYEIKSAWRLLA